MQSARPSVPAMPQWRFAAYSGPPNLANKELRCREDAFKSPRVVRCDHRHCLLALCRFQCRARIPRVRFVAHFRHLDRGLGLFGRASRHPSAAIFLCGRWSNWHSALVLIVAVESKSAASPLLELSCNYLIDGPLISVFRLPREGAVQGAW